MTTTKEYRTSQFTKVFTPDSKFKPKLKITKAGGETNWLNITEIELKQIRKLLLK